MAPRGGESGRMSERTRSGHVLVLGLGLSGFAAAELALLQGKAVTVLDAGDSDLLRERAAQLRNREAVVHLDWHRQTLPAAVDLAVISPGIHPDSVLGRLAAQLDCPLLSELEYGFLHTSCPLIAITGTNGKTTTTELVTACLRHIGQRVLAAGNIGLPLCEAARKSAGLDLLVVEVSSFQLEHCTHFAPLAATLLNLSPDHLDRYPDLEPYARAKARLFQRMPLASRVVLREDLLLLPAIACALPRDGSHPQVFAAWPSLRADYCVREDGMLMHRGADGRARPLLNQERLRLRGLHNVENVLAAIALCEAAGFPFAAFASALERFTPSRHRIEPVAMHGGVQFINDSKATNPDSVIRALETVAPAPPGRVILIAGGLDKGLDFTPLKPWLARCVRQVCLIGKCREQLARQWKDTVYCKEFVSLAAAVDDAVASAAPGDVVLLSPGCASMDMFANYAERGNAFCDLVKRRTGA
jgi:UDP-N-acetylmuramoylalanine--D-glutamate ligase